MPKKTHFLPKAFVFNSFKKTIHSVVPIKINSNALLPFLYCDAIIIAYSLSFHIIANQSKLKTNEDKKIDFLVRCHAIDALI